MSDYNKRLFSNNIRGWFHKARFRWVAKMIKKYEIKTSKIFELGCFDARSLSYIDPRPDFYVGLDADWEGGIDQVRENFKSNKRYTFLKSLNPSDIDQFTEVQFDCSLTLETLEHIDPKIIPKYIEKISLITDGFLIVTVPNEKGILFLTKYLIKKLFIKQGEYKYSWSELFHAFIGNMEKVERHQHKGFDWEILREQIQEKFTCIEQSGVQFSFLPTFCNPQIGLLFKRSPIQD